MDEVYECVTYIAGIIVVDGQVEEIEFHFEIFIELLQQKLLGVLVRYVTDHQGCPSIKLDLHIDIK